MKNIDTIYRAERKSSPKPPIKSSIKHWPYFYKSLQIVLTVWIVTILAITTQPWLDYWVKLNIKKEVLGIASPSYSSSEVEKNSSRQDSNNSDARFQLKNQKIEINAPIVEGVEKEDLSRGIGHHPETPWPNEKGNVVLAGSNFELDPDNPYGKVFISLRLVEIDDEVVIEYQGKKYYYRVFNKQTVKPEDTSLYQQVDDWILTFYTCDPPYTDWKRLVFQARLIRIE